MQPANFHSHSVFSDGKGTPEDYLNRALDQGLMAYGFSDHPDHIRKGFEHGASILREVGYETVQVLKAGIWQPVEIQVQQMQPEG